MGSMATYGHSTFGLAGFPFVSDSHCLSIYYLFMTQLRSELRERGREGGREGEREGGYYRFIYTKKRVFLSE